MDLTTTNWCVCSLCGIKGARQTATAAGTVAKCLLGKHTQGAAPRAAWRRQTCWDVRSSRAEGALTFSWASCGVSSENSLQMTSGRRSGQEVGKKKVGRLAANLEQRAREEQRKRNKHRRENEHDYVSAALCCRCRSVQVPH